MPLSWSQKRMECPPASGSLSISISNLSLKDEDRACTAVADVCGEAIELLLVADGHGGPEVRSTVKRPHWQLKRPHWLELRAGASPQVPLASLGGSAFYSGGSSAHVGTASRFL